MSNKERTPNDQRSDVKNPNNAEHEADAKNRERQKETEQSKPKRK